MNDNNRFDKFTDRAQTALQFAREEAQHLHHRSIGTEHLFLGLLREGGSIATEVLGYLGIELERTRNIVATFGNQADTTIPGELALTFHAQRAIQLAIEKAHQLGHEYIGPEHLLLGITYTEDISFLYLLEHLGISSQVIETQVVQVLSESSLERANRIEEAMQVAPSMENDIWRTIEQKYVAGQEVIGTIIKIAPFGAFIRIEEGIEGLLHHSELPPGIYLQNLHVDQQIQLRILGIDAQRHRLGLTLY